MPNRFAPIPTWAIALAHCVCRFIAMGELMNSMSQKWKTSHMEHSYPNDMENVALCHDTAMLGHWNQKKIMMRVTKKTENKNASLMGVHAWNSTAPKSPGNVAKAESQYARCESHNLWRCPKPLQELAEIVATILFSLAKAGYPRCRTFQREVESWKCATRVSCPTKLYSRSELPSRLEIALRSQIVRTVAGNLVCPKKAVIITET